MAKCWMFVLSWSTLYSRSSEYVVLYSESTPQYVVHAPFTEYSMTHTWYKYIVLALALALVPGTSMTYPYVHK